MKLETIYKHFLTCDSVCTDTRKTGDNSMFFALKGDNFNGNKFAEEALNKGATFAVIDQKEYQVNSKYLLVDNVLETLQNLATLHRKKLNTPIISLTGSNGKTTTKELINAVLSKKFNTVATLGNLNNHIGVPLTLLRLRAATEIAIVEMGANHQKEIEFLANIALPDYGLITNFGKAHLEGFGGIEGVIKGKSELYDHLRDHNKTIFINETDALQLKQAGAYDKRILFGTQTELLESQPYVNLSFKNNHVKTHLTGAYNYNNICVAIAIGQYFEVSDQQIIEAIESYIPSNNRSQIIKKNSHYIILDAYNANPTSMIAALDNFKNQMNQNKVAILGDMFELGTDSKLEHQRIADIANSLELQYLILVGENFFNIETKHEHISYFKSFEDLKNEFNNFEFRDSMVLIKGSRGMALERVLDLF
ncbi:UDP-N-acetylmuramoyl-tripeptide--D-alanyl-D-alanine ligase [Formosa sp. Hel1_31_208]|uniref:UDP-N-acetylmuramoyl-tripeptide--D-alanyl-D- alanine ligase n=1 Tax=Formosa sp. Hel1_31_208 TaxID=1798225 RepID=UPI00087DE88E|nr:UDP-N-acetylmuramoyl-tripeptide--D-alanyl-D-alanine ligase [Formosa sp. Hel1_31_208]SDR65486.1 UDP-N-acetylmuramoyl-tripeptide--D-alanyl-D-alanine ligase [Formosa sp. Hel1_31_208]